jgi:hypothetical protein
MNMIEPAKIHIKAKYVEYTKVIEEFTEEKIQERYYHLLVSAQDFIQGMGYRDHVVCNENILMLAVLGCYSDIMRLKVFHEIERVNDIKIVAYETAWLLKRRPLQIIDSEDKKYAFCNEQFAFSQITLWLKEDELERGTEILSHEDLKFFSDTLFYHLKYRNYDPQTLELMLASFMAGRKYQYLLQTG